MLLKKEDHAEAQRVHAVFLSWLVGYSISCYTYSMSITQTVDVPADHRLIIDVPREVPTGRTVLTFTPATAEKATDPDRKPISRFFGILSPNTYGDGLAYQRAIRDEWDD